MSNEDLDKTRLVRKSSGSSSGDAEDTIYVNAPPPIPSFVPDGTRIVQRGGDQYASPPPPPMPPPNEGQTVLVRPSSRSSQAAAAAGAPAPGADDFAAEGPVVGWLVVVNGPGKGRSVTLGYGMNPIGRDADNRVALAFGDEQISRKKHAVIVYDPRGRKFYLQHGDSTNLTYVGDTPVLAPTLLTGGEAIRIGSATELRFVPLCGEGFTWESA